MAILFETRFPKEVLEMKPILPKAGVTCEHYIKDFPAKSFFYWAGEFRELEKCGHKFSASDIQKIKFLKLPTEVRQAIHERIFGTSYKYVGTKKSIFLASVACFKGNSMLLNSVYSQAAYNHESEENYKHRYKTFMNTIREGSFR
tara:strand:- start:117 stop:551 length:435 start_codon:yes stop_codon:yes gene_type:complete